ncbi:immunoglobulin-binding protein 1-like [Oppia nitens]|uniref:immunoglobulin-binding protein 1-like n=1 Tax=Oppia nitens TaxID=1686743 RepID=UPI0023DBBCE2|nr:immunoglobulin-binding protein 1-like [Oppia nitens]
MDETYVRLSQLFDKGFDISRHIKDSSLATNDHKFQEKVYEGIKSLEEATRLVNQLSLFSTNESVEEIATKNVKYLLLPALLADLTLMTIKFDRHEILNTAETYYKDFIQRLNDYQICNIEVKHNDIVSDDNKDEKASTSSVMASLDSAVRNRNAKIKRFNANKEMDNKLNEMRQRISQTDDDNVDDEILREYYLVLIKRWINKSFEELYNIETEKPIVEHLKKMKSTDSEDKLNARKANTNKSETKLKPIIITRNEFQKKVYGLGYPSIPTVSVDDFITEKIKEGSLEINDKNPVYNNSLLNWAENPEKKLAEDETEEERKEKLIEVDDTNNIRRARDMDDWKDVHKRGEGNRKNMG